ncbi:MAG: alcohol dehydrogenase [Bacteroidia bacterium]|nr:MAG: alcohol dehydrogenase [Bacteroidia bacterium]
MIINLLRKTLISICLYSAILPVSIAQLYEWRGPDRSGIYNENDLLKEWPENGPEILWELDGLGDGYSSVTVTDNTIYITGRKGETDVLTALTPDGKVKWETVYGSAWINNHTGTRCTPTYVNGNLFLVSGGGDIVCVDSDGKIKWSKNHYSLYESSPLMFGISESPLVVDNMVIASPGGNKASLVAFDTETGNVVWEAEPLNEGPQYVNPKLIEIGGRKLIATLTSKYIIGVDAADGKLLWKVDYDKLSGGGTRKNHATTPVYRDGYLLIANGYDYTGVMLKLSADGNSASVAWLNRDLDPHHGGIVLLGDQIYSTSYISNSMGDWVCVDWKTGKTLWTQRWINKGSIISADGMLYIMEEKSGNVALVRPGTEKLDIVSKFMVTQGSGPYWAHPVISNGRLYIRHGGNLMVYSIKK